MRFFVKSHQASLKSPKTTIYCISNTLRELYLVRIICPHCQKNAKITHRNQVSVKMAELYCSCLNNNCNAAFVMRLSHMRDTTPPAKELTNSLYEQIANLPDQERRELLRFFHPSATTNPKN